MASAHFHRLPHQQLLPTVAALAGRLDAQASRLGAVEDRLAECHQASQQLAGLSWQAAQDAGEVLVQSRWRPMLPIGGTPGPAGHVGFFRRGI